MSELDLDKVAARLQAPRDYSHYHALPPGWNLLRQHPAPAADPIHCGTLGSLVDYLKANRDELALESLVVHVAEPADVAVLGPARSDGERVCHLRAVPPLPRLHFDQYVSLEDLRLMLRYGFVADENRDRLLAALTKVTSSRKLTDEDQGITQKVSVETHEQLVETETIPSPIVLAPRRSFPEVDQVASEYVVRIKNDGGLQGGLWSADGGAWVLAAVENVASMLVTTLDELELDIPVLS